MAARSAAHHAAGHHRVGRGRARRPVSQERPERLCHRAYDAPCEPWISPLGTHDSVPLDEEMARSDPAAGGTAARAHTRRSWPLLLTVLLIAAAVYLTCIVSPPSLMDDVDAVQAQIARNMLQSGDWVTARLDGIAFLEKAPLIYWTMAACYRLFGASDWAARIPVVLSAIALALLTAAFA